MPLGLLPAYPIHPAALHALNEEEFARLSGITRREYFMAHAPATPQSWFQPTVPPGSTSAATSKARYIQWPAAWADAMLAELERK